MTLESIINNAMECPDKTAGIIKKWLESIEDMDDPECIEACNMVEENTQEYTGPEKAAFIMLSFNKNIDMMKQIFSNLSDRELEKLANEVEKLEKIDLKQQIIILREFKEKMKAKLSQKKNSTDYTRKVLGTGKP